MSNITVKINDYNDVKEGDNIAIGTRTFTSSDVKSFAEITGDTNPLHVDEDYAKETRYGERIVHGVLIQSFVSAVLAKLPGVITYMKQDVEFEAPVFIDEKITVDLVVTEKKEVSTGYILTLDYTVTRDSEEVMNGYSTVLAEP